MSFLFLAPANFTLGLHWNCVPGGNLLCGVCSRTALCNFHAALIPQKKTATAKILLFNPYPPIAHSREHGPSRGTVPALPRVKLLGWSEAGWYSKSGSDPLLYTFHLLHFREETRGEAWSTGFTCQTSVIVRQVSSWLVPQRDVNWETGVVFSWPIWKNFLAMVPAVDFIQHCWLENLLESLDNLITLSLHSLI